MSAAARLSTAACERAPRLWALWAAARPSQVALVSLVYLLGVGMATTGVAAGSLASLAPASSLPAPGRVLVGALALVPVTVAVHYANEWSDVDTDALTERTPFSGGSGALVRTGLPRSFLRRATAVSVSLAVLAIGGVAVAGLSADALALLAAILVAGLGYSLPPTAFVRRGVGEAVNAALGGLLLPLYGVAVVAAPGPATGAAAVPFTLVVGCNLCATHWPDREADAAVGKRTLAVRWSPAALRRAYVVLAVAAGAVAAALWGVGVMPTPVALAHVATVPFLVWGWTTLTRQRSPLPAVAAMVVLAVAQTAAWWWVGLA